MTVVYSSLAPGQSETEVAPAMGMFAVCPSGQGTILVYSGRAGGTVGGADYLCMPNTPEYLRLTTVTQGVALHGVEH